MQSFRGLSVPSVHLNGSGKKHLLGALEHAGSALWEAIKALEGTAPNGRDYYPQGNSAFRKAQSEYQDRAKRLKSVADELAHIAEAVADGGYGVAESEEDSMTDLEVYVSGLRGKLSEAVDHSRVRRILQLAEKGTKLRSVKSWIQSDEKLTWTKMVREKLRQMESPEMQEKQKKLGLTDDQVDGEIATLVTLMAVEATLRKAKKGR